MSDLLLDTHALIWMSTGGRVSQGAAEAVAAAAGESAVYVSPISAWELGMLVARGRLALSAPPLLWFDRVLERSGVTLADQSPAILIDSSFLPGSPPRDPMDRIIVATARRHGLCLVTRDRAILAYAAAGHVSALPC